MALDDSDRAAVRRLVAALKGKVGLFKVGLQLFSALGPAIVREILDAGEKVFLDLKVHDIPNTAARAVGEAFRMGACFTDLHVTGGEAMLRAAVEEKRRIRPKGTAPPRLLGVTVLTSLDATALAAVGFQSGLPELAVDLARLAKKCGLDGVVASAHEVADIKSACGWDFLTVVPGIRPSGADARDQRRAATPSEALLAGADYLVVGRPITKALDPAGAAEAILAEIEG